MLLKVIILNPAPLTPAPPTWPRRASTERAPAQGCLTPVPAAAGGINMQLGCSDKWIRLGHRGDACDIK